MPDKEKDRNKDKDPEIVDLDDNCITLGAEEEKIVAKKLKKEKK